MKDTIFKSTADMPRGPMRFDPERGVGTAQVLEDTYRMANVPGAAKQPDAGVVNVERPRRGHGY